MLIIQCFALLIVNYIVTVFFFQYNIHVFQMSFKIPISSSQKVSMNTVKMSKLIEK